MKLYRTKTGIVIEKNDQFYLVQNENWDTFINDDMLIEKIEDLILVVKKRDNSVLEDILAPIGSQQELWACGVTYLRSKVGRQEESKASGGADFYGKVYEAERPEVFFKSTPSSYCWSQSICKNKKRLHMGCTRTRVNIDRYLIRKNYWLYDRQ
jgi:2-dehydro-3-deoxy-D-arabinonate dehydratase